MFSFFGKSVRIGRAFGIGVYVHPTFLIPLALFALMGAQVGVKRPAAEVASGVLAALLTVLLLFGLVLLHEFGHALTAKGFGLRVQRITIWPLGGIAWTEQARTPFSEFIISLAGPAVNFVLAALAIALFIALGVAEAYLGGLRFEGRDVLFVLLWNFILINMVLGVFNLLPAFPMDGGRVLRSALSHFFGSLRGTRLAVHVARLLALAMIIGGVLLGFAWQLILIGVFVWLMSGAELWRVRTQGTAYGREQGPVFDAGGGPGGPGGPEGAHFDPGYGPGYARYAEDRTEEGSYARAVRPGLFARLKARWRARRARRARARFLADAAELRKVQERVEALLDKVAREGMTSLTDAERQELIDASRFFQR